MTDTDFRKGLHGFSYTDAWFLFFVKNFLLTYLCFLDKSCNVLVRSKKLPQECEILSNHRIIEI